MLASPLPPHFLDTCSLSNSSLGGNALCMVISFPVVWSICLSSSLVHFKKGPKYLTRLRAQVFIPLITFLLDSLVSSSFLVLLRYSFLIFFFFSLRFVRCVILGDCFVVVSEEDGVTCVFVFTFCCFLAKCCKLIKEG